jgi:hypothetical protein
LFIQNPHSNSGGYCTTLICISILLCSTSFQPKDQWTQLLDGNLSKWEIYQSFMHKVGYKGEAPKDENGNGFKNRGANLWLRFYQTGIRKLRS